MINNNSDSLSIIKEITRRFLPGSKVLLFGSRARKDYNPDSDYDLLVVDIHLPYRSGLELVKFVRSDQGKDTPVIILTAFSDHQMQRQAGELGISDYIVKPFNPAELVSRIKSILSK